MVLCNDWALVVVLDVASDEMVPSRLTENIHHLKFSVLSFYLSPSIG